MNRIKKVLKMIGAKIVRGLRAVVPIRGDSRREWIRKLAFLAALTDYIGGEGV